MHLADGVGVQRMTRTLDVAAKAQNGRSPLPGGQARRNKLLVSWGPLVIAAPLAGPLLAPLRCAGVSVLAWGSQHVSGPSSVSPTRMQASCSAARGASVPLTASS